MFFRISESLFAFSGQNNDNYDDYFLRQAGLYCKARVRSPRVRRIESLFYNL